MKGSATPPAGPTLIFHILRSAFDSSAFLLKATPLPHFWVTWSLTLRAVDEEGNTIDFLLTKRRNKYAAHKFLLKAIAGNGCPGVINLDKSGANKEAIKTYNKRSFRKIRIRQCKYLNNVVEADHRLLISRTQGMLGFKSFESASRTLTGIEMVRMIRKGQVTFPCNFLQDLLFSGSISKILNRSFLTPLYQTRQSQFMNSEYLAPL